MNMRPDFLARLYAIHAYFFAQWRQIPLYTYPMPMAMPQSTEPFANPFAELMAAAEEGRASGDGDGDGDESGGGGTMTGLRVQKQPIAKTRSGSAR